MIKESSENLNKREIEFVEALEQYKGQGINKEEFFKAWNAFGKSRTWADVRNIPTYSFNTKSYTEFFKSYNDIAVKYKKVMI